MSSTRSEIQSPATFDWQNEVKAMCDFVGGGTNEENWLATEVSSSTGEDGQDVFEYAFVAALIGVGAIVCLHGLSSTYNWLVYAGPA